jgi:hypothetical protein
LESSAATRNLEQNLVWVALVYRDRSHVKILLSSGPEFLDEP